MNKYRDKLEILYQILRIASRGPASKSRLRTGAYVSFSEFHKYLMTLTTKQLLAYDIRTGYYVTTQRGLDFLEAYDRLRVIVHDEEAAYSHSLDSLVLPGIFR